MSTFFYIVVHNIWAGKKPEVLWSKAGPYKLFTRNLQEHLRPDALVESEIINAYLTIALSNFSEAGRGRGYLLDSFQMTDMWRGKNKGLRKIDPLDYDVLIGAVCEHHHWTLTVMYPKKRQSVYVDPFGASEEALKKCTAVTRAFMRQRGHNCSRWSSQTVPHVRQVDATSCGVIVCKLADMILNEEDMDDVFDKTSILRMRLQIGKRLIKETDDLTNLCRACGSYDTDVQWIACTPCDQWFHRSCVGQPPVEAPFYCPLCI
ncbi:uncharacterized protein LOC128439773 [Pleuronectes platessa]|uniref:uncharacterized protein LOC128439773 n=1 Tax=Pleuronectes platessa TaxID=8262 RepID=UPI00232A6B80|nr:uncharacterized protein LOC128439773 [Pleuronectes platessa]